MKTRTFNIMQYETHPETGEQLITEDKIKEAVAHKTIKQWAYICHDKDVYSEKDESEYGKTQGEIKPRHWHIVCRCDCAMEIQTIAKWFGVSDNFVDIPRGRGAFLDCVQYLTHEDDKQQAQGKVLYLDETVKSNFDFRMELLKRAENIEKYGSDLDSKTKMRIDVLKYGKSLRACKDEDIVLYSDDNEKLKKLRMEYLSETPVPGTRLNYYITGIGGAGKGIASRAIARSLYPDIEDDRDIYFEVGSKGSAFDGYDGQPVIIWSDRRAIDLLQELNGRGNVFEVFDPHPTNAKQNIKYGSIKLVNSVNIVNGIEDYYTFLDGLAGEYKTKDGIQVIAEDKGQSYRRFPIIIPLYQSDLDIMFSKYFIGESSDPTEYETWKHIVGNFRNIRTVCRNNEKLAREIESKMLVGLPEKSHELLSNEQELSDEQIREMLKGYGEEIAIEQTEEKITEEKPIEEKPIEETDLLKLADFDDADWTDTI